MIRIASKLLLITTLWAAAPTAAHAQATGPSPAETRLKEMVKSLTQRVTQAEAEKVTVAAEKATVDAKVKEQEAQIKKMTEALQEKTNELSELREDSIKKAAELQATIDIRNAELKAHKGSLEKWKTAHVEISGIAKKKEAERAKQATLAAATQRRVEDLRARNASLYATANEILDKYKKFGLGEAISAREPFTGNTRAKLKVQVQEYADALLDGTADSKRPPPTAPSKKP